MLIKSFTSAQPRAVHSDYINVNVIWLRGVEALLRKRELCDVAFVVGTSASEERLYASRVLCARQSEV